MGRKGGKERVKEREKEKKRGREREKEKKRGREREKEGEREGGSKNGTAIFLCDSIDRASLSACYCCFIRRHVTERHRKIVNN